MAEKKKEQDQDRTAQQREDDACVQQICTWLRQERKDWFTVAQLKVAKNKYVFDFNKQTAQTYIQRLAKAGKLIGTSAVLPKVGQCEVYLPMISFETPLEEAVPQTFDENLFFPEKYDVSNMQRRLAPGSSRTLNLKILTQLYRKRHQRARARNVGHPGAAWMQKQTMRSWPRILLRPLIVRIAFSQRLPEPWTLRNGSKVMLARVSFSSKSITIHKKLDVVDTRQALSEHRASRAWLEQSASRTRSTTT